MKTCKVCHNEKSPEEFRRGEWRCRSCYNEYTRLYLERKRRERGIQPQVRGFDSKAYNHAYYIRRKHGLTLAAYQAILEAYGRSCAICHGTDRICLDHNHTTGTLRGVLCSDCNVAIGLLGYDPARISAAAQYVQDHRY